MIPVRPVLAALLVVPVPAHATEVAAGVLAHAINIRGSLPPGYFYEGTEEHGSVDVQAVVRSAPQRWLLHPRLTAKVQVNTRGRTSFASIGAEWRQHVLRGRVYGQGGVGVTVHDGYVTLPDPAAPGLSAAERGRRIDLYFDRTGFGSRVLFNPNASVGVRLDRAWAVEIAYEHFSHARIFSNRNPGIDTLGLRLVRTLGR